MPRKKKAHKERTPSRTPLERIIGDFSTKSKPLSRKEAATIDSPPHNESSDPTLLFNLLLVHPESLLSAGGKSKDQIDLIRQERRALGIPLEDGWTLDIDRQDMKVNGKYLLTNKVQYRNMKKLIRMLSPKIIETKRVTIRNSTRVMVASRVSRTPEVARELAQHYLNANMYAWFRQTEYCWQYLPTLFQETGALIHDIWPHINENIWAILQNDDCIFTEINHAIVYSMTEPYFLSYRNKRRYNQLKMFLRKNGELALAALAKQQSLRHIDDDQREVMTQTLSFLRFMQFTLSQRHYSYAFVDTFDDASKNASIKKDLDALTTIVLPTIDEIIREYEQRVLAEIQRMTKTQGGKVKKR